MSLNNYDGKCFAYLFTFGTIKEFRKALDINSKYTDDMVLCTIGVTDDLNSVIDHHKTSFEVFDGCATFKMTNHVEINSKDTKHVLPAFRFKFNKLKGINAKWFHTIKSIELFTATPTILNGAMEELFLEIKNWND